MAEAGVNVQRFKMADTEAEGVEAGSHLMGTVAKELVIKVNYVNRKVHVESCFCIILHKLVWSYLLYIVEIRRNGNAATASEKESS